MSVTHVTSLVAFTSSPNPGVDSMLLCASDDMNPLARSSLATDTGEDLKAIVNLSMHLISVLYSTDSDAIMVEIHKNIDRIEVT